MDKHLRKGLQEEIREARRRERAAAAEGAECADNAAGAVECRGEARAYRETVSRLGALLARAEAEEDQD